MADTIKRCSEHLKNFTLMDNTCLKSSNLSMQAMGLFAYLMTLPNDWVVYKSELVNHFSNGRDAVYKAFNELIDNGYITFIETKNEKGQFKSCEYFIHEQPVVETERSIRRELRKSQNEKSSESTENGNPQPGKPCTGNPYTENPSLLSTNNTKDLLPSTNTNSSCNFVATKKSKKIQFKKTDYQKAKEAYWSNCGLLYVEGKISVQKPVLVGYIDSTLKKAFTRYGVDVVVEAIKESINHQWLIDNGYPLHYILGPNELPKLINKTYANSKPKDFNVSKPFRRWDGSEVPDFFDDENIKECVNV